MKMTSSAEQFLVNALGAEGYEELCKVELYKLQTNTVVDHEEIKTALQIVPRTILSLLHRELSTMTTDRGKSIPLPVNPPAVLSATKMANDVYTGEIHSAGKILAKFVNRSLPGIGLVIMTTFELYDVSDIAKMPEPKESPDVAKIQQIIDERLALRDMVSQMVEKKISEREVIENLIKMRLTQMMSEQAAKKEEPMAKELDESIKSKSRLREFLDKKAQKKKEFHVEISKSETVNCPDCGKDIFSNGAYTGCICMGDDRDNKIYIRKTEKGFSMRFPKSWDAENISMLLETLRNRS